MVTGIVAKKSLIKELSDIKVINWDELSMTKECLIKCAYLFMKWHLVLHANVHFCGNLDSKFSLLGLIRKMLQNRLNRSWQNTTFTETTAFYKFLRNKTCRGRFCKTSYSTCSYTTINWCHFMTRPFHSYLGAASPAACYITPVSWCLSLLSIQLKNHKNE